MAEPWHRHHARAARDTPVTHEFERAARIASSVGTRGASSSSSITCQPPNGDNVRTPAGDGKVERVESLQIDKEASMALARVVTFDGVSKDRIEELKREMSEGERPEGLPATEILLLHDAAAEKSLVILFFDTEDDYNRGDETLNAMPASDTPGQRTSATKYDVAHRMNV